MKFCIKCGKVLRNKPCPECNTSQFDSLQTISQAKFSTNSIIQAQQTSSIVKFDCPNCPNKNARYQQIQMRAVDQSPTQFYTCTNCNYCQRI